MEHIELFLEDNSSQIFNVNLVRLVVYDPSCSLLYIKRHLQDA